MRTRTKIACVALAGIAALSAATLPVSAYRIKVTEGGLQLRWPTSRSVLLEMQLGAIPIEPTLDGNTTWNAVGTAAARAWSSLADVNFVVNQSASTETDSGNSVNNVFFSSSIYGERFNDALGITLYSFDADTGIILETDVIFDNARVWNSYRGAQRTSTETGGRLYDLRRVAIHEFGHVLGLDHPDQAGQAVTAIMNSRVSDIDTVQQDDTNGLVTTYGPHTTTASRLVAGSTMRGGQWLTSVNGRYRLYMQGDSNLVLYDMVSGEALWWTGASAANGQAIFQSDGNFVVYDGENSPIWFTGTAGNPGAFMVLQDDGNLVLYSAAGAPLWHRLM